MEKHQDSIPELRKEEERQGGKKPISRVRQWVYAGIAALGLTAVGCGGRDVAPKGAEVAGPGGGPIPMKMNREAIPSEIQTLLGENAVRLQNPVIVQYKRDIFLVDSDGQKLWRLVSGDTRFLWRGTVDRPHIDSSVVYGTHASRLYDKNTKEQITTYYLYRGPNGMPWVNHSLTRNWVLDDITIKDLKKYVEDEEERRRKGERQKIVR